MLSRFTRSRFADTAFFFYKVKVWGNPALNKSVGISVAHFGNSCSILNFLIIIFVMYSVVIDYNSLKAH